MGFFGGPSKKTLLVMAYGVAETVAQLQSAETIGGDAGEQILSEIEASGGPTTVHEVICYTVDVINENKMGWYKKNKFIGMVYGSMIVAGVRRREAASIKAEIEIMSRSKERRRIKILRSFWAASEMRLFSKIWLPAPRNGKKSEAFWRRKVTQMACVEVSALNFRRLSA